MEGTDNSMIFFNCMFFRCSCIAGLFLHKAVYFDEMFSVICHSVIIIVVLVAVRYWFWEVGIIHQTR